MKPAHTMARAEDSLFYLSATDLLARYRRKELSPVEVTRAMLERIEALEPRIEAFQLVDAAAALEAARASEARWLKGAPEGLMDGVPITIKDIVLTKGWPTLSGSRLTDPGQPWDEDCPAVAALRAQNAVMLGKTTTPEYGWKAMTDSPLRGTTRNPWNLAHTPGGSSGGAAAAVAAGICPLALGTDGGGSIRIPSSFSGIYGFKPTFGRVPNYPTAGPFATISTAGPMGRTVADLALMLSVIAVPDSRDWQALPEDPHDYRDGLDEGVAELRIAFAADFGEAEVAPDVMAHVTRAAKTFEELSAHVELVEGVVPSLKAEFEALWYLAFSRRLRTLSDDEKALLDPGFRERAERGIDLGLEDFLAAQTARIRLGERLSLFHDEYDLLLTPTVAVTAPRADVPYDTPAFDRWRHSVPFTLPFNLTGQPGANVPCGVTGDGLPVGLQIVGRKYADALVLRAARAYEAAAPFAYPREAIARNLSAPAALTP